MKQRDILLYNNIINYSIKNKIIFKNYKFAALVYCYYHDIKFPKCKICENKVRFVSTTEGFKKYCSSQCRSQDKDWQTNHAKMWTDKNIDTKKTKKLYKKNHRQMIKRYSKKYFATEKGRVQKRVQNSKRRALRKGLHEKFTATDRAKLLKRFGEKCFNCGSTLQLEVDHHIPLSKGEILSNKNAVLLCKLCNIKKSNKLPNIFYSYDQIRELFIKYNIGN